MDGPYQDAIEAFISITGSSEHIALQKLLEHDGDLDQAVNAHFSEGDRSITYPASFPVPQEDLMAVDDPVQVESQGPRLPLQSSARSSNPFGIPDLNFSQNSFDGRGAEADDFKDGNSQPGSSGSYPPIVNASAIVHSHGQETQENVRLVEEKDVHGIPRANAPPFDDVTYYSNDIEEEMVQAAIAASKLEVEELGRSSEANGRQEFSLHSVESLGQFNLEAGNASVKEDAEDLEDQTLVRQRSRSHSSEIVESADEVGGMANSLTSSPETHHITRYPLRNGNAIHSDEWGGISPEEHDEAVMLEAALFGGTPNGSAYHFTYPHRQVPQTGSDGSADFYPWRMPRPPSPTLVSQRLLREQQDGEYLTSLQADREKEQKAMEEVEIHRLEEAAAREAALEEEKHQEEERQRKLLEEEEFERLLSAKQASLPAEPAVDDTSAVTLLVRMPDGSRHSRRFLKADKLRSLFDFIDIGRGVKPGTYRVVRPYPRRAFSDYEGGLSLSELGLTSKQEALFLELI